MRRAASNKLPGSGSIDQVPVFPVYIPVRVYSCSLSGSRCRPGIFSQLLLLAVPSRCPRWAVWGSFSTQPVREHCRLVALQVDASNLFLFFSRSTFYFCRCVEPSNWKPGSLEDRRGRCCRDSLQGCVNITQPLADIHTSGCFTLSSSPLYSNINVSSLRRQHH